MILIKEQKLRLMISSLAYLMSYDLEFIKEQFLVEEDFEIFNDII